LVQQCPKTRVQENDAMTALMMALVAGIAVASDGTERISTDTEQRLCIGGEWEGFYLGTCPGWFGLEEQGSLLVLGTGLASVKLTGQPKGVLLFLGDWIDEGNGRFQMKGSELASPFHGIYRREAGYLTICMTAPSISRPTAFKSDSEHVVLFLKLANPPKK
jgi:hypothetical protein